MENFQAVFALAEEARIQGDNAGAVELYHRALSFIDPSPAEEYVALYHMWGVALINLGRTEEARYHFKWAERYAFMLDDASRLASIDRDVARSFLIDRQFVEALLHIGMSLSNIPLEDLAERGASLGFKARILLAQSKTDEALEIFGTADVLLQRSGNHHYELYNLMHFLEGLIEHRLPFFDDNWADVEFARAQTPRLRALAETYGGPPHQERAAKIVSNIFAEREC